jgi:hypothetical protein
MESDPLAMALKNDEKCKLVAKYVYHYPVGRNEKEASRIWSFLNNTTSDRAILSQRVNKYKNMLHNMEAEETLHNMHTSNLLPEVKQKIFTEVLWDYLVRYYTFYNTCKFTVMDRDLIPCSCYAWPQQHYMPCFLAEIQENNDQYIFFSETELAWESERHEHDNCRICYYDFEDFEDFRMSFEYNYQKVNVFCCTKTNSRVFTCMPIECNRGTLKSLVFFLETKNLRVAAFKQSFCESIENLAHTNDKKGANAFITLLTLYKDLPKTIARMYESELHRSVPTMLLSLPTIFN